MEDGENCLCKLSRYVLLLLLHLTIYFVISMQARQICCASRTIGHLSEMPNYSSLLELEMNP